MPVPADASVRQAPLSHRRNTHRLRLAAVAKDTRVREELVINKEVGERTERVSDTVRRTEVDVDDERTDTDTRTDLNRRTDSTR